jgi:N-acetylglutamate synthase-like GNAT family acetyltransferase
MIASEMKRSPNSGRPDAAHAMGQGAIRAAWSDDLPAILDVINVANKAFYRAIVPSDRYREPYLDLRDVRAESRQMTFYVYEENDRIVAAVALEGRTKAIEVVSRLYVLPALQRRGIGTALLSHVENSAKRDGLHKIVVWTDPKATWAVSFYKRQGYRVIEPGTAFGDPYIDARAEQHPETLLVLRKSL